MFSYASSIVSKGISCTPTATRITKLSAAHASGPFSWMRYYSQKFTATMEWIKIEGTVGTVGISKEAAGELGDIVFCDLPKVGATFGKGKPFAVVESVKASSDVYAPMSGKVLEINGALTAEPSIINQSPEDKGWMVKLSLTNTTEESSLLDAAAYKKHVESSKH